TKTIPADQPSWSPLTQRIADPCAMPQIRRPYKRCQCVCIAPLPPCEDAGRSDRAIPTLRKFLQPCSRKARDLPRFVSVRKRQRAKSARILPDRAVTPGSKPLRLYRILSWRNKLCPRCCSTKLSRIAA